MLSYNVDFFNRQLANIHHDTVGDISVSDDYISLQNNTFEIRYTSIDLKDAYIYITRDDYQFFGAVMTAEPTSNDMLKITYRSFLSVFDEEILFDTNLQKKTVISSTGSKTNSKTLERMLKDLIDSVYVTNSDTKQRLKINVVAETETRPWGFNLKTDTQGQHYCIIGLYSVLIVNALKKYGVGIFVEPDFQEKTITLRIINKSKQTALNIDGGLHNVVVKTLKVNDRPKGTNKLTVYNTDDYTQFVDFYVYTDRTWGVDDRNRITPVVRDVRSAMPDSSIEDPDEAFALAAIDVAYGILSGLEWDNLIELEVAFSDPLIRPMELSIGQTINFWYKNVKYTSILTGRDITPQSVTLIFGSERIKLTKRFKK